MTAPRELAEAVARLEAIVALGPMWQPAVTVPKDLLVADLRLVIAALEAARADADATTESLSRCGHRADEADARAKRLNDALTAAEAALAEAQRDLDAFMAAHTKAQVARDAAQAEAAKFRAALRDLRNYVMLRPRLRPMVADALMEQVDAALAAPPSTAATPEGK
jgi:ABC-type transporter Mla subunit MlaD